MKLIEFSSVLLSASWANAVPQLIFSNPWGCKFRKNSSQQNCSRGSRGDGMYKP